LGTTKNLQALHLQPNTSRLLPIAVFLCFFVETFCLVQGKHAWGYAINSLVFFISGLLIAVLPALLSQRSAYDIPLFPVKGNKYFIVIGTWLAGLVLLIFLFLHSIKKYPVDINYSDILPTIDTMASRVLKNGMVYRDVVVYPTYSGNYPGYLPLHWVPATVPKFLGIDIRWAILVVFIIGLASCCFWLKRNTSNFFLAVLPVIFSLTIISKMEQVAVGTAELMVTGYYILLCIAIVRKDKYLVAGAIVCCLLSRYSLVLWLPLYLFLFWLNEGKAKATWLLTSIGILIFTLFILPFFWQNPGAFLGVVKSYTHNVPLHEWEGQHWQLPGDKPYQLFQGLGMACFVYDHVRGSLLEKIDLVLKLQIIFSTISVILAAWWYYSKNKKRMEYPFFSLLALKFYFCFFYGFLVVPYSYLFFVPLSVSMIIVLNLAVRSTRGSGSNPK
jgi:hypothetical protein